MTRTHNIAVLPGDGKVAMLAESSMLAPAGRAG
jgi:hypothetical protein